MEIIGIELNELAILSPIAYEAVKSLERWSDLLRNELNLFDGPPDNYMNVTTTTTTGGGGNYLQILLDPMNTPFDDENNNIKPTKIVKKLWQCLTSKKCLQDDFIHYIYKRTKSINHTSRIENSTQDETPTPILLNLNIHDTMNSSVNLSQMNNSMNQSPQNTYKILHKDQEAIHSFCINQKDKHIMSLCTTREIIEIDFKKFLNNNSNEDCNNYYYNQHYQHNESFGGFGEDNNTITMSNKRRSHVLSRRPIKDVKKLAAHPTLPYYLSGTNEGIVKLWHWGSSEPLSSYRQIEKSYSAKITKLLFNVHGNKFGVSDMDGYLHLYQLLGCSFKSYLTLRCHKVINDFLFIDSSSLLLTIGTSNDSSIISLWDTLMPTNKSLIKSYRESADTSSSSSGTCCAYSPLNHFVYCGNRKGEVNIYDVRVHKKLQKFVACESAVKALDLDAEEYYIATGSSEGNVKIWDIKTLEPIQAYHNEHSKSSLIRNVSSGVNQINFTTDNHLMSCGAEGTLILRDLKNLHL